MPTASATWSATMWNVVVHSTRKSAPARSTPRAASARIAADLVPALLLLQRVDLVEVDRGHRDPGGVQAAEARLDPEVQVLVVGGRALPAHPAHESDGLHGSQSATTARRGRLTSHEPVTAPERAAPGSSWASSPSRSSWIQYSAIRPVRDAVDRRADLRGRLGAGALLAPPHVDAVAVREQLGDHERRTARGSRSMSCTCAAYSSGVRTTVVGASATTWWAGTAGAISRGRGVAVAGRAHQSPGSGRRPRRPA